MNNRYRIHTHCRNTTIEKKASAVGYANMIMFMCPRSSRFQLGALYVWIIPPIDHQQIFFFFNSESTPIGYITWAHLADDVEHRLLTDPNFLLHPTEWNEGGRTWIIDYCFPNGGGKEAFQHLKNIFQAQNIEEINWVRRTADYKIRKISRRKLCPPLNTV